MPHRYLCHVLEDMRACHESRNFSYLKALIEEAQWMGERMEASLVEGKNHERWQEEAKLLKSDILRLREEKKDLQDKILELEKARTFITG